MDPLDNLIPAPRLLELDHVDVTASAEAVWQCVRREDLARSALIRGLFFLRSIPERLAGRATQPAGIRLDDLSSTAEHPGFQVLSIEPPHAICIGAIGKVWKPVIAFEHVPDAERFADFADEGFIKVAWSIEVESQGTGSRLSVELRVDATDRASWEKFQRYFLLIGPASRFIRRSALASIARELGTLDANEQERPMPSDAWLRDANVQLTQGITIEAPPEKIWPWLVQMGCNRAGFYSVDSLDNGAERSAREVHPEWQQLAVGDLVENTPDGSSAFEVLQVDGPRVLVLGGLFDPEAKARLAFAAPRPKRFWHVSWAFVLEPITSTATRLHVRARAAFSPDEALHAAWLRPVHQMMERAQLRHLRARVESTLPRDDGRDLLEGLGGISRIGLALATPYLRRARLHWGVDADTAARSMPGDELVSEPRWSWTHGVEIAASAAEVWPWIAQIGATRAGFYSYQWLENLVGCDVHNAERVHAEWATKLGDDFFIHPKAPALKVARLEPGVSLVVYAAPNEADRAAGLPWVATTWLFFVEPLGASRCRFVSRYRVAYSDNLRARLSFGPSLLEPIGFAMDRRMLLGVKARSELARAKARAIDTSFSIGSQA
jgi:hypothetical protein